MDDVNQYLVFSAAAPFIAAIIGFAIKPVIDIPSKFLPLVSLTLSAAWGGLLVASGNYDASPPEFVATTVFVASAAAGFHSTSRTYVPARKP